jgi:hypothetical protein
MIVTDKHFFDIRGLIPLLAPLVALKRLKVAIRVFFEELSDSQQ